MSLADRDRLVLVALVNYVEARRYLPTLRELAAIARRPVSAVHAALHRLERTGYLEIRGSGAGRELRVTEVGRRSAAAGGG